MAIDTAGPRTRRAILMGALGGAVAAAATVVGRATTVTATDGDPIHVGGSYSATTRTQITGPDGQLARILWNNIAVTGESDSYIGIYGRSDTSTGVYGVSNSATAVFGGSNTGRGVWGGSSAKDQPGTLGWSLAGSTGVHGHSSYGHADPPTTAPVKTGVYGTANEDASAVGVRGRSTVGTGVVGVSASGRGGVFTGGRAQLKLTPSAHSHPDSGHSGDLFVDSDHHLWFCRGGTNWVKLA